MFPALLLTAVKVSCAECRLINVCWYSYWRGLVKDRPVCPRRLQVVVSVRIMCFWITVERVEENLSVVVVFDLGACHVTVLSRGR